MKRTKKLTVCIISFNDEEFLSQSISSVKEIADEIFVIDIGSTDHTIGIAKNEGVIVHSYEWKDSFCELKNYCMQNASGDWLLFLQAYEVIEEGDYEKVTDLIMNPNAEAYLLHTNYGVPEYAVHSPIQTVRLLRKRDIYGFSYRSYERVKAERLYTMEEGTILIRSLCTERLPWDLRRRRVLLEQEELENNEDPYLLYMRGICYFNNQEIEKSMVCLERAYQAADLTEVYTPHLYKCLALAYMLLGKQEEAKKVIEEGIEYYAFYTDFKVLHAEILIGEESYDQALEELKYCEQSRERPYYLVPGPELPLGVILEEMASVYKEKYQYSKALDYYKKAYKEEQRGDIFAKIDDLSIVTNTENSIEKPKVEDYLWEEDSLDYYLHLAIKEMAKGEFNTTSRLYSAICDQEVKESFANHVVQMLVTKGDIQLLQKALSLFDRTLTADETKQLHKNHVFANLTKVITEYQHKTGKEIQSEKKASSKKNNHYLAGRFFKKEEKEKIAYLAFLHALEIQPDSKDVWKELLTIWSKNGDQVNEWEMSFGSLEGNSFADTTEFFYYVHGIQAFYEGRFTKAKKEFLQMVGKLPVFDAYCMCAATFEGKDDHSDLQAASLRVWEQVKKMREVI